LFRHSIGVAVGKTLDISNKKPTYSARSTPVDNSPLMYNISAANFLLHRSKIMRTHALIRRCIMNVMSCPSDKLRQVFNIIREYKFDDMYFGKNIE